MPLYNMLRHRSVRWPCVLAAAAVVACTACHAPPDKTNVRAPAFTKVEKNNQAVHSLPYLTALPIAPADREKNGLTHWERNRAQTGLTVYCSERTDAAIFLDMDGKVRHILRVPGARCLLLKHYAGDDFLFLGQNILALVSWDGTIKWQRSGAFHHDVAVTPDGDIFTLESRPLQVALHGGAVEVFDNTIVRRNAQGDVIDTRSLYETFAKLIPAAALEALSKQTQRGAKPAVDWNSEADLIHANALLPVPPSHPLTGPLRFIVSLRHLDALAIIDLSKDRPQIVWSWGPGTLDGPHDPTFAPTGEDLLVFDNGRQRKWSRVLRILPTQAAIDPRPPWQYKNHHPLFFSETRGSAQGLRNGNVLICESEKGRLFEITPDGQVVWEYWNPEVKREFVGGPLSRVTVYRARRLSLGTWNAPALNALLRWSDGADRP